MRKREREREKERDRIKRVKKLKVEEEVIEKRIENCMLKRFELLNRSLLTLSEDLALAIYGMPHCCKLFVYNFVHFKFRHKKININNRN